MHVMKQQSPWFMIVNLDISLRQQFRTCASTEFVFFFECFRRKQIFTPHLPEADFQNDTLGVWALLYRDLNYQLIYVARLTLCMYFSWQTSTQPFKQPVALPRQRNQTRQSRQPTC